MMNQTCSQLSTKWSAHAPYFLAILRIVTAAMFMFIGTIKLFAFPVSMIPAGGTVDLFSLLGLAGVLEFLGGALLLVGLCTRPVAFILAGEMAVAYFLGHFSNGFWPMLNGGQPALLYCFIFLYLSAAGAGAWSLDRKIYK